ncbi:YkvA family protein [Tsuneonella sp. HG249]
MTLWVAARDPRTPIGAKLLAGAVAAYAFSPIDLIPDFIPVLGLLDDVIIVPLGVWLVLRMVPAPLLAEFRAEATQLADRPVSRTAAAAIVLVWTAAIAATGWWLGVKESEPSIRAAVGTGPTAAALSQNLAFARTYQLPPLKPKGDRSPYLAPTIPAQGFSVG